MCCSFSWDEMIKGGDVNRAVKHYAQEQIRVSTVQALALIAHLYNLPPRSPASYHLVICHGRKPDTICDVGETKIRSACPCWIISETNVAKNTHAMLQLLSPTSRWGM